MLHLDLEDSRFINPVVPHAWAGRILRLKFGFAVDRFDSNCGPRKHVQSGIGGVGRLGCPSQVSKLRWFAFPTLADDT